MKVYVDDMQAKSKDEEDHLDDLKETFDTLRKYKMKLNPTKCVFNKICFLVCLQGNSWVS